MKKILCILIAAWMILFCCAAMADGADGTPLTWQELTDWAAALKEQALSSQLLNDPAASLEEDGSRCLIYDFATLYADRPEMTADTVINGFVIYDGEYTRCLRAVQPDCLTQEALAAFANTNAQLAGTASAALLYLEDRMPQEALWGLVQRDGQRITGLEYHVLEQAGEDAYTDAVLRYDVTDSLIIQVSVSGLAAPVSGEQASVRLDSLRVLGTSKDYSAVKSSYVGSELAPFGKEDLKFSGIDFLTMDANAVMAWMGEPVENVIMDDEDGTFLQILEYENCTAVFNLDEDLENPVMSAFNISGEGLEGPRAVRIGDSFASVFNRFRNGEGEYNADTGMEILYGNGVDAPAGAAEYGSGSDATLRYYMKDGKRTIVLYLGFEEMHLADISIYVDE